MGQKVHPTGIRLGIAKDWTSNWYAEGREYSESLCEDREVREAIRNSHPQAAVSRIRIERFAKQAVVTVCTARPGVVIGKKGEDIERLRHRVAKQLGTDTNTVKINIEEIRKPELDAELVADSVAHQLEGRVMFRRSMRRAVSNAMRLGALGIKVSVAGRLNGAEIARTEWYREGRVPLHTLRADIDYGTARAETTYGVIGVKVWIFKGEVHDLEALRNKTDAAKEKPAKASKG